MRRIASCFLAGLGLGSAAVAQTVPVTMDPFAGSEAGDSVRPITSYPLGNSQAVARNMLVSMRLEQRQRDLCWELGCLVIANESTHFRITGFHVLEKGPDGSMQWSKNQFGQFEVPLFPKGATFLFKTGNPETCDWPVLFILKEPTSHQTIRVQTRTSLCTSPHRNSLVRVKVVYPEVIVEG